MNLKLSIEYNEYKFLDRTITYEKKIILQHYFKTKKDINNLERDILKKRGFKFVGSTVIYAHMQATGMVNDHEVSCFRYDEV